MPILRQGETCWRKAAAGRVAFLVDGEAYFSALEQAVERAEHSVYLACWDIDSRVALRRDDPAERRKSRLGSFLDAIAARREDLQVHILDWDYAVLYALERESLPVVKLEWATGDRVHFRFDGAHPTGASHHQKIVVVDDAVAFAGGFDPTRGRWDTRAHAPGDRRRVDHHGKAYLPFHDVDMLVDAEVAACLGELFRDRWRHATGEELDKPAPPDGDPWPQHVRPDVEDLEVGIARTRAAHADLDAVREVEDLHLEAIGAARHAIYIENQYLTSHRVCQAIEGRLSEENGPDVVMVLPERSEGWLEETTMNTLRVHFLSRLRQADRHGRLGVYYPVVEGLGKGHVNVHAKVLVVDDRLARVGSSNLSNRSMRLDSECDLAIESAGDDHVARAVTGFRDDLLAEHLGVKPPQVAEALERTGSLLGAVESLRGGGRTLVPLEPGSRSGLETALDGIEILDPERPIGPERLAERLGPDEVRRSSKLRLVGLVLFIVLIVALAAIWHFTDASEWADVEALRDWARTVRTHPAAPFLLLLAYVLLTSLMFPITVLFFATAALFDPVPAFLYAMTGCLAAGAVNYGLGLALGRDTVRNLAGRRVNRLSRRLARRGVITMAIVRLFPVAPYVVVNLVAGASHIRFRDYLLGTAIGMAPGILLITVFTDLAARLLRGPSTENVLLLAGLVIVAGAVTLWIRWRIIKRRKQKSRG